ncbi:MAG: cytochrome c biogenesis heme-transporting ATPase CcmA [Steroidobacteraceae bacterium]|nr:cytochrome c biogenesis heme-transporting ATPase CcmA [Steroidobacteraceae bacterium]
MTETRSAALEARNLHLWRGDRHVLRGLCFGASDGEALHVRGPNGTGKTTLLRTLAGFLWPEEGELYWMGERVERDRDRYCAALAYLGHENAMKADLTPRENLRYMSGVRHPTSVDAIDAALQRLAVYGQRDLPFRSLSAGQRRRVAMARVLLARARLWLLDEPFTNLDVGGVRELSAVIADHVRAGGIAILTAHADLELPGVALRRLELS